MCGKNVVRTHNHRRQVTCAICMIIVNRVQLILHISLADELRIRWSRDTETNHVQKGAPGQKQPPAPARVAAGFSGAIAADGLPVGGSLNSPQS